MVIARRMLPKPMHQRDDAARRPALWRPRLPEKMHIVEAIPEALGPRDILVFLEPARRREPRKIERINLRIGQKTRLTAHLISTQEHSSSVRLGSQGGAQPIQPPRATHRKIFIKIVARPEFSPVSDKREAARRSPRPGLRAV